MKMVDLIWIVITNFCKTLSDILLREAENGK